MKNLITALILFISLSSFSQGPPAEAVPDSVNMPLILEVAKSCHYELYFEYYKDSVIAQFAKQYGWDKEKIGRVKNDLVYKPIDKSRYYNAYAFDTKDELDRIKAYNLSLTKKQLLKRKTITNSIIIHNMINSLEWECKKFV